MNSNQRRWLHYALAIAPDHLQHGFAFRVI
jgi:hypothetical protein